MEKILKSYPCWWLKVLVTASLLIGVYFSALAYLFHQWKSDDNNYCYLVPAIVLYLIWEKRKELSALPPISSWSGIFFIGWGICLFWLGELGGEYYSLYISFWFVLIGLCWIYMGWKKLKIILFPLVFTLTMFPLPNFFNSKISLKLKLISSKLGVILMQAYGMSVYREGNIIDLGFTQLQVVDACSGLRYLYPLIVLGILLSYFYKARLWKKIIVIISTIPLTVFTNSLRIALTGILSEVWGTKAVEGFFHDFEGWIIFMFTLGCLLIEIWILKKIFPEKVSEKAENAVSIEQTLLEKSSGKPDGFLKQPQFLVTVVLLCATLILSQKVEFREIIPINRPFSEFPMKVGQWTGTRNFMENKFIDELDFSDYVMVDYRNDLGKSVDFYVAYYESQRKGESIHPPATCLRGGGWEFKQSGRVMIPVSNNNHDMMPVNRALIQKGPLKQLSYYWYPSRGRLLTNAYQLKFYNFWDALTKQRTDGALVRLITPIGSKENVADADRRLQTFVRDIEPVLAEFLPGRHP